MRISDKLALARSPSMNETVTVCLPALANDNNPNGYRSAAPSPCGKPRTAASPPAPRGHPRMPGRRRQAVRRRAGSLRWQPANPAPHQWARTAMCTRSTDSIRSYRAPRFRWVPWGLSQRPETSGPLARSPPARSTHPCRHAAPWADGHPFHPPVGALGDDQAAELRVLPRCGGEGDDGSVVAGQSDIPVVAAAEK